MIKRKIKFKGFSLAEMMVVMLIISIVLAAMLPIMTKRPKHVATTPVTSSIPVGSIMAYYGTTEPTGWLICDGRSAVGHSELVALLNSNYTPDLRGYFIRGLDTRITGYNDPYYEENNYSARILGSIQNSANLLHSHGLYSGSSYNKSNSGYSFGLGNGNTGGVAGMDQKVKSGLKFYTYLPNSSSKKFVEDVGLTESRPKNIALNYIIKY